MASPDEAINFVLINEGGYADDPVDPGGATNGGISQRFLAALPPSRLAQYGIKLPVTVFTIKNLTDSQIHLIYLCEFWQKVPFTQIANQRLANYIFDMGVQFGIGEGVKTAQRACNSLSLGIPLDVDGVLGAGTLHTLNSAPLPHMLVALPLERIKLYELIVKSHPPDHEFLDGWLERANRI